MVYTQCNVLAIYIWLISGQSPYFAGILWSNSIAIEVSYEIFGYLTPMIAKDLKSKIPFYLDTVAHIAPFILLYSVKEPWQLSHSLQSLQFNLLWGLMNCFDLNYIYQFKPKMTKKQIITIWLINICSHFLAGAERLFY